jgi:hypothetical protein
LGTNGEKQKMAKIILIGSLTKDLISLDNNRRYALGGSVYYAGEAFNKFDHQVTVIPLLSKDKNYLLKDIHQKIIINPIYVGNTFLLENIYSSKNIFERKQKILNHVSSDKKVNILELGNSNLNEADLIFVGPQSPFDISLETLSYIYKRNKNVCLYAQGFFRNFYETEIEEKEWKEAKKYLSKVNYLILSEKHLKSLSKKEDLRQALQEVSSFGPKEIILSQGEKGYSIYVKNKIYSTTFPRFGDLVNPNGLTSTFSAVYLSQRMDGKSVQKSMDYAIHAACIKMNTWLPLKSNKRRIDEIIKVQEFLNQNK